MWKLETNFRSMKLWNCKIICWLIVLFKKCDNIRKKYINNGTDAWRQYISGKNPLFKSSFANGVVTCVAEILLLQHTQSIVCATVKGQCWEYLGYKTLGTVMFYGDISYTSCHINKGVVLQKSFVKLAYEKILLL